MSGKDYWKEKIVTSIPVAMLPVFMLVILGPVEIYGANITDFDFLLSDFLYLFLLIAGGVFIALSLLFILLPKKINRFLISLCFSTSMMIYVQNMFLNVKLNQKDGSFMDWDSLKTYTVVNGIIWITVIVLGMVLLLKQKDRIGYSICRWGSMFLILIQLAAFGSVLVNISNSGKTLEHYQLSAEGEFSLAKGHNIIVIVLDSLGSTDVENYLTSIDENPETLRDFTFYNNYDSKYAPTFPSMMHLLSGVDPDVSMTRLQWMESAWNSERSVKFYEELHSENYVCNLYSASQSYVYGSGDPMAGKIDNLQETQKIIQSKLMIPMMLKYSLFRYAPYVLKPRLEVNPIHFFGVSYYVNVDEIFDQNIWFYDNLKQKQLTVNEEWENAFVLYHLKGLHKPLDENENLELQAEEVSRENAVEGCFLLLEEYVNQLKNCGLYDSSTIIIMSDHGEWENEGDIFTGEEKNIMASLFVKEPYAEKEHISVNTSPLYSDDFQATVLKMAGIETDYFGKSIYDYSEGERRERVCFYMNEGLSGYQYFYDKEDLRKSSLEGYDVVYPSKLGW